MLDVIIVADALALLKAQEPITGETSDGYHTFNELYHHRAVLFSVIVANYKDRAWKSVRHHDGTMYDGMFIVGIDTPDGQATYHYDIDPYWDMFDCKVREFAPKWDGHTPAQAIERIGKLKAQEPRVMCAAEVAACSEGTVLWVEERQGVTWNLFPLEIETSSTHPDTGTNYLFFIAYHDIRKFECSEYNQTWRFWTSRPDEKRRTETPWK
jgi:hypothetical protein